MSNVKYTELDFSKIKTNLKEYLQGQTQFKDYDFEGSSLSILLDVLAYNTAYNGFYLNMLASEMFLDSAYMRDSVVSRAKHLGYTPRSVKSLDAVVDIIVSYVPIANQAVNINKLLFKKTDALYTIGVDGNRAEFVTKDTVYLNKTSSNTFEAKNVELVQGKRLFHTWNIDTTTTSKPRYQIPNQNIDTSTLVVTIQNSSADKTTTIFAPFKDLTQLSPTSAVYFLQEYEANKYEIVFGDGILGIAPEPGNIVTVEYVISTGPEALGASSFKVLKFSDSLLNKLNGLQVSIKTSQAAKDYVEAETIESIKLQAPRYYTTQSRAVTKNDYEILLKKDIPTIEHIRVWGGEDNVPPYYGKVFCSIQPKTGSSLNEIEKRKLVDGYIKDRSVLSLEVVIVEPEYISMVIDSTVNFFPHKTKNSSADIKALVYNKIVDYKQTSISGFDTDFRYSKLVSYIDSVDHSIESNITTIKIKCRLIPPFDVAFSKTILLNNKIDRGDAKNFSPAITSTQFLYANTPCQIADDGSGTLFIYYVQNNKVVVLNPKVGTVDYDKGEIIIKDLVVDSIPNDKNYIDLFVVPKENDIITLKNQILLLDNDDIHVNVVDLNTIKLS